MSSDVSFKDISNNLSAQKQDSKQKQAIPLTGRLYMYNVLIWSNGPAHHIIETTSNAQPLCSRQQTKRKINKERATNNNI